MSKVRTFKFTSGGSAYNLDLGFTANQVEVVNFSAADTEVWKIESLLDLMGDNVEIWHYMHDNDGGDDIATPVMKASSGYLAAYDSTNVGERQSVTFDFTGGASEDLVSAVSSDGLDLVNGERVRLDASGGLATGLSATTVYYVVDKTASTCRLSLTKGGSNVAFTSDGTTPNYLRSLDNLEMDGFKGVTIGASFMSDGDVIYVKATMADRSTNLGDIG